MKNYLGEIICQSRQKAHLTTDQYAVKYGVTVTAVFKFERGYTKPTLERWLKMAEDAEIPLRRAVLLWVKSKLPDRFEGFVELQDAASAAAEAEHVNMNGMKPDYSKFESPEQMRDVLGKDKILPKGLKELLEDDELWAHYKPTGHEINLLRDLFGPLGNGSKTAFRDGLRLIREFIYSL